MIFLQLYTQFFMTGLFSIGGGLATLPFLYDMAERTGWFTAADIADMIAVSESTPGAIGINMSTYCGFTTAGIIGAVVATIGLISPGIIVIIVIAKFLQNFRDNKYVDYALYGLRAASMGLIVSAGFSVFEVAFVNSGYTLSSVFDAGQVAAVINVKAIILGIFIFAAMKKFKKIHPVFFIAFAAAVGVIFSFAGV